MMRRSRVRIALILALVLCATGPVTAAPSGEPEGKWNEMPAADVLSGVVGVRAEVPESARTASSLGTLRAGSGAVIDENGLVLTIGYLILEAETAWIVDRYGEDIPADIVAYDHETGFGLLRARESLDARPLPFGTSSALELGEPVLSASGATADNVTAARVVNRRDFAGYWEYLLADALFTFPPHRAYGGAALIDKNGSLVGIGSLFVGDAITVEGRGFPGNMFVPIDAVKPILADLLETGRRAGPVRPWLGLFAQETEGRVLVTRTADGGPAASAGVNPGDLIIGVDGKRVGGLADFLTKVWARGHAGVAIPLDILPHGAEDLNVRRIDVRSGDRYDWLRLIAP